MHKQYKLLSAVIFAFICVTAYAERADDIKELDKELQNTKAKLHEMVEKVAELSQKLGDSKHAIKTWRYINDPDKAMIGIVMSKNKENPANGVVISGLTPGGPAELAGLKNGDIITDINGTNISKTHNETSALNQAYELLDKLHEGDKIKLAYLRNKKKKEVILTAQRMQPQTFLFDEDGFDFSFDVHGLHDIDKNIKIFKHKFDGLDFEQEIEDFGDTHVFMLRFGLLRDLDLTALNQDLGSYFGTDEGILITGVGADLDTDLKAGDVITQVDSEKVNDPKQLIRYVKKHRKNKSFTFSILRHKKSMKIDIELPEYHSPYDVSQH